MFFSFKILSASVVTGPFATSAIIFALIFCALNSVITFSIAAGARISVFNSQPIPYHIYLKAENTPAGKYQTKVR